MPKYSKSGPNAGMDSKRGSQMAKGGEMKMETLLPQEFKAVPFMQGEYGNDERYMYGIEYQNGQMAEDHKKLKSNRSKDRY